ncbi:MAG: helix-turn-helix transcriptional regulator [Pseudomonadota bacterium]
MSIERHVGKQLRSLRQSRGKSQSDLAGHLGVDVRQIEDYEQSRKRINSTVLYSLSEYLGVSIISFFADLPNDVEQPKENGLSAERTNTLMDFMGLSPQQRAAMRQLLKHQEGDE